MARGFTLIELSIVLVIIGLIVGGVLVGRDLIKAAEVRAQVTQVEKYNQAANTFRGKYGYLPGNIPEPHAAQFGFITRGSAGGFTTGTGTGVLGSVTNGEQPDVTGGAYDFEKSEGALFWQDLSRINLINETFTYYASAIGNNYVPSGTTLAIGGSEYWRIAPQAKLGGTQNFVFPYGDRGRNYFGLAGVLDASNGTAGSVMLATLTPRQAFAIDQKTDDGLPLSGATQAMGLMKPGWVPVFGPYGLGLGMPAGAANLPASNTTVCAANTASPAYNMGADGSPDLPLCGLIMRMN